MDKEGVTVQSHENIQRIQKQKREESRVSYIENTVTVTFIKSPKQSLGDLLFLLHFLLLLLLFLFFFFLSVHHELVHGRSQELQDRIS